MDDDDDGLKPWNGYLFAVGFILLVAGAVVFGIGFNDPVCIKNDKDCENTVPQKCPCTIDQPSVDDLLVHRVSGAICLALGLIITSIDCITCWVKTPICCKTGSSSNLNVNNHSRQQQRNNDGWRFSTNTTQATGNSSPSQLLLDAATRRTTAYGISTVIPPSASTVNLPPSAPIDQVVPSAPIITIPTASQPPSSLNTRRPGGYRRPPPPVRRATRDQNWTDRPPGYDQLIHPPTYYEALEADGRFDAEDNYNESNYDVSIVYQLPLENDERYSTV